MKVAVCAIMKNNYRYFEEWVEHYLHLGFDNVIIYDNNDVADHRQFKTKHLSQVIIINYRGVWNGQLQAYQECYERFGDYYDWIAFFDSDEYLILNQWHNVKEMLYEFPDNDLLAINWLNYGDMGVIKRNMSIPVNKFFTKPSKMGNEFYHYKQFIRTCIPELEIHQHSVISKLDLVRTDVNHQSVPLEEFRTYTFLDKAYIKHVLTKTLTEYIEEKAFNGKPTGVPDKTNQKSFGYFFDINEHTAEKDRIVQQFIADKNKRTKYTFLLNPNYKLVKNYSDHPDSVVITSDKTYENYLNRPNRILIMDIRTASNTYPNMQII